MDFDGDCEHIPSNRRYLLMSLLTLWVGIGLSVLVGSTGLLIVMARHQSERGLSFQAPTKFSSKEAEENTISVPQKSDDGDEQPSGLRTNSLSVDGIAPAV